MSRQSLNKISALLRKPLFSTAEARKYGVHPSLLAYYCKKGVLERVSRGFYQKAGNEHKTPFEWQDVALIASSIPDGVICLITALAYYELTDELARKIWIAVPRESRPPKRTNTKIVRFSNMSLGSTKVSLGKVSVKIFDKERTVIDSFRFLSKEIAIKALKKYLQVTKSSKPDFAKLNRYARQMRVNISPYIEAITI